MKSMLSHLSANNLIAGLIVAIVALPLCIAFAIASGANPMAGIISGVVGGMIAASFGSSRFQVSGPAAAFITIIYGVIASQGFMALLAATFIAGLVVLLIAAFRLGKLMELMPHSIIVGFTTGIGVLILLSQLPVALGIDARGQDAVEKLIDTASRLPEARPFELALLAVTLLITLFHMRTALARWIPAPLAALLSGACLAWLLETQGIPIRTIGKHYTVSLSSLEASAAFLSHAMALSEAQLAEVVIAGITLGLLVAVETLLSSRALDAMTRSTHNPDRELVGHGLANLAVPFLGGIPVSGVIVRGSTNVMAGATAKSAAILHAVFLALFIALLFPLVSLLPLVALSTVLMLTARRLIEVEEIRRIYRIDRNEGLLVIMIAILTVAIDLTVSVPFGIAIMLLVTIRRMVNDKRLDRVECDNRSVITVDSSLTFLTSAGLRNDIARHLDQDRISEIDLGKTPCIDASGAIMLAELLKAYPEVRVIVSSSKRMQQLHSAGLPLNRIIMQGNNMVDMPSVYQRIQEAGKAREALSHAP